MRSTEESFWAVRRLLEHLAATEPLVVVVDDIQWAEPLFWDLLDHLVEWTEAPVLLVALARPELRELRPELAQTGRRVTASVSLEGLDADTTRELAARLLDTDELPADLIERIPDSTEGNPLFVRELVQMLVDDGVLARDGDRWRLTIDADAIEVPPTVLSLLASRVERLPDDERQVVELASVIGTEFDRGLLESLAGVDVGARLGALIDRLRRKDLIEPSGAWAGDHPVYRFHHVLIRDAAYRRLLKGHRADLHERVGRYLDAEGVGRRRDRRRRRVPLRTGPSLPVGTRHPRRRHPCAGWSSERAAPSRRRAGARPRRPVLGGRVRGAGARRSPRTMASAASCC